RGCQVRLGQGLLHQVCRYQPSHAPLFQQGRVQIDEAVLLKIRAQPHLLGSALVVLEVKHHQVSRPECEKSTPARILYV
ncbi:MAG: hypothetical protein RPU13_07795, partial [Candidatus Sedimenticola sp. (ex Thyasira tokunagai)]